MTTDLPYRPCVGTMVLNRDGLVFIGRRTEGLDPFDPSSPVRFLGTESRRLPEGLGTDFLLPLRGTEAAEPAVLQWPGAAAGEPTLPTRLFHFTGAYLNMPGEPRDITELQLTIDSADGNDAAQDFLLSGRLLASYLDVRSGESVRAAVDAAHREGFTQRLLDADGDGYLDLLLHVPHFSEVRITVKNTSEETDVDFWEVHLTGGPKTGWVSGGYGSVFRMDSGVLRRVAIPGLPEGHRTHGMSMVSDAEFWVVASTQDGQDCQQVDPALRAPVILHYTDGFWDSYSLVQAGEGFQCESLHDLWVSADGWSGFAGGRLSHTTPTSPRVSSAIVS